MTSLLRIGTRGSPLALWQARYAAQLLQTAVGSPSIELVPIETTGDRVHEPALSQIGGDGLFTKEIQRALLADIVDVAVHSLKDLPTAPVPGLILAAVPPRGPTSDVFVSERHQRFDDLPRGATVATGSLRRRAQILYRRPDLHVVELRGNVETRLRKLVEQGLDAIILAQAGLERLGLQQHVTEVLDPQWMLPAVGQGALGLECRADDKATLVALKAINDPSTQGAVLAERALLRGLGGGCLVPIGAATEVRDDRLELRAAVLSPDGTQRVTDQVSGPVAEAEGLGGRLAQRLLSQGAKDLLQI
jgi:hydroxymethylbilane synthase